MAEPEFLSTQIIEGAIDVHPVQTAIVVHYSVDARVLSEHMETMGTDLKQCKKIINIPGLCCTTDISALARQLVSQTHFIQPSRLPEVEQLLIYLLNRKLSKPGFRDDDILDASSKGIRQQLEDNQIETSEVASLINLPEYLELLYEDLPDKVNGTSLILQLARNPDNLLELAANESMFLALTRVLRDDWRKSIELSSNIVYIFFCYSKFSNFHSILLHHKVGSLCMTIIDHKIIQRDKLLSDVDKLKKRSRSSKAEHENAKKRAQAIIDKQETLMRVCLYLLFNLAESPSIEQKMKNKGIITNLVNLLSWESDELTILAVSFLKKLSIYGENKDEMLKGQLLKKLLQLIPSKNEILVNVTIRLLMNLSFDPAAREVMIILGYLPKLVTLLNNETHRVFVLFVLYHISIDDNGRVAYTYTDCIPTIMKLLLETAEPPDPEVLALSINLACNPDNAQLMCQGPGLKLLMNKALSLEDPLLMKMIRNISQHPGELKKQFLDFLVDLGQVFLSCNDEDLVVEVLGILGNLSIPDLDYKRFVTELNVFPTLVTKLKDLTTKDDMLLEIIIVCGTFSTDADCAELMMKERLPELLMEILRAKQDDDEIILQIAYNIYQFLLHPSTRELIMKTDVPDYFIELINDKNRHINKICAEILTIMTEHDSKFGEQVKEENFRHYNQQWIEMVTGETLLEDEDFDEDYMDPYYLHMADEIYSPEMYFDANQIKSPNISHSNQLPGQAQSLYTSPIEGYDALAAYGVHGVHSPIDNDIILYNNKLYDSVVMGEVTDLYSDHPALATAQDSTENELLTRHIYGTGNRPPSRLNF